MSPATPTATETSQDTVPDRLAPGADAPLKVLVVDDHADGRDLVCAVLTQAGFSVRAASNGLEALLTAYEMRPAVIVMDVSMPILDGIQATRLIKAVDAIREARVIACTGSRSAVYGLADSRRMAEQECAAAHQVLAPFGSRAARLHELADLIVRRKS